MSTRMLVTECFDGNHADCKGYNGPADNPNFHCDCDCHQATHNTPDSKDEALETMWEYCPSCGGDLDTGYECTKCGRDWQSYVHDTALRVETETEQ